MKTTKLSTWIRNNAKRHSTWTRGMTDRNARSLDLRSIPIKIIDGDRYPFTKGLPYWKTGFHNCGFTKVLYTPSTFELCVGRDWIDNCETINEWCARSKMSPYNKD